MAGYSCVELQFLRMTKSEKKLNPHELTHCKNEIEYTCNVHCMQKLVPQKK